MYGEDDFRAVFMFVPEQRFLDKLEQLNHISKLCFAVVERGRGFAAKNCWRAVCSD